MPQDGACLIPFSKEVENLARLKPSLAPYRVVFGQDDLLSHLANKMDSDATEAAIKKWRIRIVADTQDTEQ